MLGQKVTITEDGVERKVTAAEAFLLYMTKRGLEGDGPAGRAAMTAIEDARASIPGHGEDLPKPMCVTFIRPGSINTSMEQLRIARKLYRRDPRKTRMALEPWIVEAALARFCDRRLSPEEQRGHRRRYPNTAQSQMA